MKDAAKALGDALKTARWCALSPPEPAATAAQLAAAEKRLGRALPPLLVAVLRTSRAWSWRGDDEDVMWMPPDELALGARAGETGIDWEIDDADDGVEPVYDVPSRLTFAYSDARVFQIDFAPADGGTVGQVVAYDPEEGRVARVAPSLDAFLADGLRCLREVDPQPADDDHEEDGAAAPASGVGTGDAALADAQRLTEMFAALDAAVGNPEAMAAAMAAFGGRTLAQVEAEDEDDPDPDDVAPLPTDPALAAEIGRAAKAFVAAVEAAAPALRKRLRASLSAAKAKQRLKDEGKTGPIPETLFPLYAAFDGQKGEAPFLPCPVGLSDGLAWLPLEDVCYAHSSCTGEVHRFGELPIAAVAGVRAEFWNPRWIPLMRGTASDDQGRSGCHLTLFADFDPAAGSPPGQVLVSIQRWGKQGTTIERRRIADGLPGWLDGLAADISGGRLLAGAKGFKASS